MCAIREAAEETGLALTDPRFVGVTNDVFDEERHYVTLWFEADCHDGKAVIAAPYEMSEIGWFAVDNLPSPLFPPLERLLSGNVLRTHSPLL